MSDDGFKGGGEINPPVMKREDIVIRQNQGQDLSDKLDHRFGEEKVELAKKEQDPPKIATEKLIKPKSDAKVKSEIKALRDRIKNAKPSELLEIKAQLENLKLLYDSPEISALIANAISAVDNKVATPDQTNQNLTLSRADILTPQMEEKAKIVDDLYKEFKDPKFQQQLKDDIDEDKKKLADIKKLLDKPESITLEDRRRLSGDYLSKAERTKREEELRIKRERINKVDDLHDRAKERHSYHEREIKKSKTKLTAHKKKMNPILEKDKKTLDILDATHKLHLTERDKNKTIARETGKILAQQDKHLENLLEEISKEKNNDNTELLKDNIRQHFIVNRDKYYKKAQDLHIDHSLIKALTASGLTDELKELQTKTPHLDLKDTIATSEEVATQQKTRCNSNVVQASKAHLQKPDTAKEYTSDPTSKLTTKSEDTKQNEKTIPDQVKRSVEAKPTKAIAPDVTPKITGTKVTRAARFNINKAKQPEQGM